MFVLPAGAFAIIGTTDTYDARARRGARDARPTSPTCSTRRTITSPRRSSRATTWSARGPGSGRSPRRVATGSPSSASREHAIAESAPGLVRVTGGKLTTYRVMARDVVDAVRALARRAASPIAHGDASPLAGRRHRATRSEEIASAARRSATRRRRRVWCTRTAPRGARCGRSREATRAGRAGRARAPVRARASCVGAVEHELAAHARRPARPAHAARVRDARSRTRRGAASRAARGALARMERGRRRARRSRAYDAEVARHVPRSSDR